MIYNCIRSIYLVNIMEFRWVDLNHFRFSFEICILFSILLCQPTHCVHINHQSHDFTCDNLYIDIYDSHYYCFHRSLKHRNALAQCNRTLVYLWWCNVCNSIGNAMSWFDNAWLRFKMAQMKWNEHVMWLAMEWKHKRARRFVSRITDAIGAVR